MVRCIYILWQCNLLKYPAELHGAIGAVIPSLVELISRENSEVISTIVHLAKHGTLRLNINDTCLICAVGLHTAIIGAIPQILQLFTYSLPENSHLMALKSSEKICSEAAALICTLSKHSEPLGF
jgi:hypothetical protein